MAQVKPLDLSQVHDCQEAIGYTFQDELLLWEALQASGSLICHGTIPRYRAGNTRLAIVGDKLLDLLLSLEWYPTWHDRRETAL